MSARLKINWSKGWQDQNRGTKDQLLKESSVWILDNVGVIDWRDKDDSQLLLIKGHPGKGKIMLMIGLIEELSK